MTRHQNWLFAGALILAFGVAGVSTVAAQEQGTHRERVQRAARGEHQDERRAVPRNNEGGGRGNQAVPAARGNNQATPQARGNDQAVPRQANGGHDDHNRNVNGGGNHYGYGNSRP